MAEKNSFILYNKYRAQIDILSNEQAGILMKAIFRYQDGLDLPEMDDKTSMCFSFIKYDLDINNAKYEEVVKAKSEAGKKSAEAKKTRVKSVRKKSTDTNTTKQSSTKSTRVKSVEQTSTSSTVYDNDYVYVNDNDYVNDKDIVEKEKDKKEKAFDNPDLQETFNNFVDMRKKLKKPMTDNAINLMVKKINKLSNNDDGLAMQMLENSIRNSWTDIYPIREPTKQESIPDKWEQALQNVLKERGEAI